MPKFIPHLCLALLAVGAAGVATAQQKNRSKGNAARNPVLNAVFGDTWLKAKLDPAQEQKLTRLSQQMVPQLNTAQQKIMGCYTKEQQEVLRRAREQAVRAKVNPKNIDKRVKEAEDTFELTAEQKEQLKAARAELAELKAKFASTAAEFLSAAQVKLLFGDAGGKKKKK